MQEMLETGVLPLGGEDPLEEGMAIHSSILAWRIHWTEEPGRLQSIGLQRVRQLKRLSAHTVPQSVLGVLGYCVRGIHEQTLVTVISVAAVFFSKALPLVTSLPEASVAD